MTFTYGFIICIFHNQIVSSMNANELLKYMTIMNTIKKFKIYLIIISYF